MEDYSPTSKCQSLPTQVFSRFYLLQWCVVLSLYRYFTNARVDGSSVRARELPLEINEETGDVELTLPRSLVTKQFAVTSTSAYVEMSNFTSIDNVDELDGKISIIRLMCLMTL